MGQDMMRLRVVRPHPGPGDGSGVQNPRRFPPGSWSATKPEPESATEQEPRPKESLDPTELERFERTFLPHMRAAYNLALAHPERSGCEGRRPGSLPAGRAVLRRFSRRRR